MQNPTQVDPSNPGPKTANENDALRIFDLGGRVAVVTGATGVLGGALAIGLARAGAKVAVLGRRSEAAEAIAPGFFLEDQNRALLVNQDQSLTHRGRPIIDHTPICRFGQPDDLVGQRCRPLRHGGGCTGRWWFFGQWRRLTLLLTSHLSPLTFHPLWW